jgi:hypothetical protein
MNIPSLEQPLPKELQKKIFRGWMTAAHSITMAPPPKGATGAYIQTVSKNAASPGEPLPRAPRSKHPETKEKFVGLWAPTPWIQRLPPPFLAPGRAYPLK